MPFNEKETKINVKYDDMFAPEVSYCCIYVIKLYNSSPVVYNKKYLVNYNLTRIIRSFCLEIMNIKYKIA